MPGHAGCWDERMALEEAMLQALAAPMAGCRGRTRTAAAATLARALRHFYFRKTQGEGEKEWCR